MTLPFNNTEDPSRSAAKRSETVSRGGTKRAPSTFSKELPNTRKLSNASIRKAGIMVALNAPEQAEDLLSMLGITQHLRGEGTLAYVEELPASYDTRPKRRIAPKVEKRDS